MTYRRLTTKKRSSLHRGLRGQTGLDLHKTSTSHDQHYQPSNKEGRGHYEDGGIRAHRHESNIHTHRGRGEDGRRTGCKNTQNPGSQDTRNHRTIRRAARHTRISLTDTAFGATSNGRLSRSRENGNTKWTCFQQQGVSLPLLFCIFSISTPPAPARSFSYHIFSFSLFHLTSYISFPTTWAEFYRNSGMRSVVERVLSRGASERHEYTTASQETRDSILYLFLVSFFFFIVSI